MRLPELEGAALCPPRPELAAPLADFYRRNRTFFAPWEPRREEDFYTEEGQLALLLREQEDFHAGRAFRFYLVPHEGEVAGLVGLNSVVWGAFCSCFLGYKLDRARQGQGLMTRAVEAAVTWGFECRGLHRVEANVLPRNLPSRRVLERCGFVCEGISPRYLAINGVWEDHLHMVRRNGALEGPGGEALPWREERYT